jgi:hypothetical protein
LLFQQELHYSQMLPANTGSCVQRRTKTATSRIDVNTGIDQPRTNGSIPK